MIEDELQSPPANLPNIVLLDNSQNEDDSSGGNISPERQENSLHQVVLFDADQGAQRGGLTVQMREQEENRPSSPSINKNNLIVATSSIMQKLSIPEEIPLML